MLTIALVTWLALLLSAWCNAQDVPSLQDVLTKNSNLTKFYSLLQNDYPDLLSVLESQHTSESAITVLAPSNDAFDKIPDSSIGDAFKANETDAIRSILEYHILPGYYQTSSFSTSFQFLPTWLSDPASTNVTLGQRVSVVSQPPYYIFVSGLGTRSTVTTADVAFSGGVLHVIDMPVIPPVSYPETAESFNTTAFLGLNYQNKTLAEFMNVTSDITIFAPSNNAFQSVSTSPIFSQSNDTSLLTQLSEYHIVLSSSGPLYSSLLTNGSVLTTLQGSTVTVYFESNSLFINSARLIQSDLLLANGVMHILDNVLDYNVTNVQPNPQLPTQAAVLPQGTSSGDGSLPFTSDIPNTSAPTSTSAASTSSASASGMAASTTAGSAATSTADGSANPTRAKKGAASRSLTSMSQGWVLTTMICVSCAASVFLRSVL